MNEQTRRKASHTDLDAHGLLQGVPCDVRVAVEQQRLDAESAPLLRVNDGID
jgi:hypothetical protein